MEQMLAFHPAMLTINAMVSSKPMQKLG